MATPSGTPAVVGLASIQAMFVQTALAALTGNGELTLQGLSRSTLYFADRPQRVVGHIHSRHFIDLWGQGENSFADDPPNAVLSFIEPGDDPALTVPADVVVVLRSPRLNGDRLTYLVEVIEGTLPELAGGCALFIDPFGRPRPPAAVAGVHRRTGYRRTNRWTRRW